MALWCRMNAVAQILTGIRGKADHAAVNDGKAVNPAGNFGYGRTVLIEREPDLVLGFVSASNGRDKDDHGVGILLFESFTQHTESAAERNVRFVVGRSKLDAGPKVIASAGHQDQIGVAGHGGVSKRKGVKKEDGRSHADGGAGHSVIVYLGKAQLFSEQIAPGFFHPRLRPFIARRGVGAVGDRVSDDVHLYVGKGRLGFLFGLLGVKERRRFCFGLRFLRRGRVRGYA